MWVCVTVQDLHDQDGIVLFRLCPYNDGLGEL